MRPNAWIFGIAGAVIFFAMMIALGDRWSGGWTDWYDDGTFVVQGNEADFDGLGGISVTSTYASGIIHYGIDLSAGQTLPTCGTADQVAVYNVNTHVWECQTRNAYTTMDASSGSDPVADSYYDTLTLIGGTGIDLTGASSTDTLTWDIETAYRLPLLCTDEQLASYDTSTTSWNCVSRNVFTTINASSGSDPVADTYNDTLNITGGTGITVTGNSTTDTVQLDLTAAQTLPTCDNGETLRFNSATNTYACQAVTRTATRIVCGANVATSTDCDYVTDGTDDQVQLQAAIDAIKSNPGGLLLMRGVMTTTADVILDGYEITVRGENWSRILGPTTTTNAKATTINVTGATKGFNVPLLGFRPSGIVFENFYIECTTSTASTGIYVEHADQTVIQRVHIQFCDRAVELIESDAAHVLNNSFLWNGEYGIYLGPKTNYTKIIGNEISDGDNTADYSGIYIYQSHSNRIVDNTMVRNRVSITLKNAYNNIIANNQISLNKLHGIAIQDGNYFNRIEGNAIINNNTQGISGGSGIQFSGTAPSPKNNYVVNNTIADIPLNISYLDGWQHTSATQQYGIRETQGTGNEFVNNTLFGNTLAAISIVGATTTYWGNRGYDYDKFDVTVDGTSTATIYENSTAAARLHFQNSDGFGFFAVNNGYIYISTQETPALQIYTTTTSVTLDSNSNFIINAGGSKEIVLNDESTDTDTRIESDNKLAALFVQGSDGNVGIGTSTPAYNLDIHQATGDAARIQLSNTESGGNGSFIAENNGILFISTGENTTRLALQGEGGMTSFSGNVTIGNTTAPGAGTSGLMIKDGTALTGMPTDTAAFYADNVGTTTEMFVIDEGGHATQISPHNAEGEWVYYSCNINTLTCLTINMEDVIRDLAALTGKDYFQYSEMKEP